MNLNKCLLLIFVLIAISFSIPNNDNVKMEARVYFKDINNLYTKLGDSFSDLDIATRGETDKAEPYLVIITNQKQIEQIRAAGFKVEITYSDIKDKFREMTGVDPNQTDMLRDFGYFFTYWEMIDTINHLATNFPGITSVFNPGNSYQGKPLWTIKISDNPLIDEPEPAVYINGAVHAREPGATHCCIDFATYLVSNYGQDSLVTWLVKNREIFITPVMNPDGYVYNSDSGGALSNWRKSRRIWVAPSIGVDLNRNYGYRWGVDNVGSSPTPSSETYRGPTRFSDVETQIARDFMFNQKIRTQLDYHTYGRDNMYPWAYGTVAPPDSLILKEMVDTFRLYNQYPISQTGQISRVLYLANGNSVDWEYADTLHQGVQKFITFATTIEWGRTDFWYGWNLPAYVDSECLKNRPNSFYLTRLAGVFFEPRGVLINDSLRGNLTNQLDPGETAHVWFKLRNRAVHPLDSAYQLTGKLKSLDTMVIILDSIKTFPTCRRRDSTNNRLQQFKFFCRPSTNPGRVVTLRLEMNYKDDTLTMMQPVNFTITIGNNPIVSHDVGCTKLEGFAAILDSGVVLAPACSVYNYGTGTENYSVRMKVGNFYNRTAPVTAHLPNTLRRITFPACTTFQRGVNAVSCSTELSGDLVPSNDKKTASFFTQVVDVGTIVITSPPTVIDSGAVVTPKAQVKNFGNITVNNIPVRFKIGTWQDDTIISSLAANESTLVAFADWTALPRGLLATSCSTRLVNDLNNTNDKQTGSVLVQVRDVGTTAIISPPLVVDSGQTITPQARIKNFGNVNANNIPVRFDIGSWQDDTVVVSLAVNESTLVTFASWTATQRGIFDTKCSTRLIGDMNPVNDKKTSSVTVGIEDVGIVALLLPDTVNSGTNVTPACSLFNFGTTMATYNVIMKVNGANPETLAVTSHAPAAYLYIVFANRTIQTGLNTFACSLTVNDMNPNNDTAKKTVFGVFSDVGTTIIISPEEEILQGATVTPACSIYNYGNIAETYKVRMKIGTIYDDTAIVFNHQPGTSAYVTFPVWSAIQSGEFVVSCSTELTEDMNQTNDKQTDTTHVIHITHSVWELMTEIPLGFSGKRPKSGSCMAGLEATGKIYFLKASNTSDFYSYTPNASLGLWTELIPMPDSSKEVGDGKKPKRGASIAAYEIGKCLFALRGNNTPGFWKYQADTANGQVIGWSKMTNTPMGMKNPKDASGLVAVPINGTDYVFAMKGSRTDEFYLYDIANNIWTPTPTKPGIGNSGKLGYKKGSCLTWDSDSFVYVLKGNYGDFFKYNLYTSVWTELRRYDAKYFINRDGKKKKPKDGASLVFHQGYIYMLKGGNTREVWKFYTLADSGTWAQMNPDIIWDIPLASGKKVKGGGAMIKLGDYFYASKGANTQEFYGHGAPVESVAPDYKVVTNGSSGNRVTDGFYFTIAPNPTNNTATIKYNLPVTKTVTLKLYNIAGEIIKSHTNSAPTRQGSLIIDVKELPAGVYLLHLNMEKTLFTRKLVVEK